MKWLRWIAGLAAAVAVLLAVAAVALDAWIESAGGRRMVEQTLTDAVGLPVRLSGEFDVRLLPPGANGTEFLVLDEAASTVAVRSRSYDLALELGPLLRRELRVDRLRLEWLVLGEPGGAQFALPSVEVSDFAVGQPTDIEIDLGPLGAVTAVASWFPGDARVLFDLAWSAEGREDIELEGALDYAPEGFFLTALTARVEGQRLRGSACLLAAAAPVLALDLEAETLDLEALEAFVPGGEGGSMPLPFEVNLRLRAGTLLRGPVTATDVLLEFGMPPDCSRPVAR